jgi:hypothetical protein
MRGWKYTDVEKGLSGLLFVSRSFHASIIRVCCIDWDWRPRSYYVEWNEGNAAEEDVQDLELKLKVLQDSQSTNSVLLYGTVVYALR